jgi:polyisoprenoid-binding protein YceI
MKSQPAIRDFAGDECTETYWFIEPGYTTAHFKIKSFLFLTVAGSFNEVAGTIILDEANLHCSSVTASIKAVSINTGNQRRDTHLRSADFLAVEEHPEISFRSTSVEKGRDRDTLNVKGTLTIKNTSREITLLVTQADRSRSPQGEEIIYYTTVTEINRHDFGVSHLRGLIGSKLKITIHIQAQKQGSIRVSGK